VPVKGIISDGQETIGSAVAFVFPEVPHQRCQFHYLKQACEDSLVGRSRAMTGISRGAFF
jgi:hypothetical protein